MKITIFSLIFLMLACSSDGTDSKTEEFSRCESSQFRADISQPIPAVVKTIKNGEPFFDGNSSYLEIDAQKYLPNIAEEDQVTLIRIFAPSQNLGEVNSDVMVKGSIYNCITGFHGALTNDFKLFYLIENLSLTN